MKKVISVIMAVLVLGSVAGLAQAREARPPANDDISAASAIPALPFSHTVSLKGATLERNEVQPSCRSIQGSVWYSFSVPEESTIVGELSSTGRSTLTVFEQTAEGLVETSCLGANTAGVAEFKALPERLYLVQLGSAGTKQGVVDLDLRVSEWREETLWEYVYRRESGEQHIPLLSVSGAPRAEHPSMYDVQVGVSEQQPVKAGVFTFGLVTQKVHVELLRVPASTTEVSVRIAGRYDSSQYTCAADDGEETCHAAAPLKDLNWLTGGEGSRAELVIVVRAEKDGQVLQERTVTIPYAGQATALVP